jgi:hypothetical protein
LLPPPSSYGRPNTKDFSSFSETAAAAQFNFHEGVCVQTSMKSAIPFNRTKLSFIDPRWQGLAGVFILTQPKPD